MSAATPIPQPNPTSIASITVRDLFGNYSYQLTTEQRLGDYRRFFILYGDNGSGKTTILRLAFSILSDRQGKGDKSFIAQIPFKEVSILFDDGTTVSVSRDSNLFGSYNFQISQPSCKSYQCVIKATPSNAVRFDDNPSLGPLLAALHALNLSLYFLPDDRRPQSTLSADTESETEAASTVSEVIRRQMFLLRTRDEDTEHTHHLDILPVLGDVTAWIRKRTLTETSTGDENAHTIYQRVIRQIAMPGSTRTARRLPDISKFIERLTDLAKRSTEYSKFGFITSSIPSFYLMIAIS